ncbi:MAG: lipopolysaccharide biosynthesis protein [Kofleriaceae bacterium]
MTEQRATALGATGNVVAARALRASARIVIVFLLARFYSAAEVATFAYAFVTSSLVAIVCDLGLTDFAVREIAAARSSRAVELAVLKVRTLMVPVAIVTSSLVITLTSSTPILAALAIATYVTALSVSDLLGAVHRAHHRYRHDALEAAVPALALIASAVCAAMGTTALMFFAALGLTAAGCVGVRVVVAFARTRPREAVDAGLPIGALVRNSRWFAARAIAATAMFEIAVVLLQQLSTTDATAAYAVAQRPVGLLNQSLAVVAIVFMPTLSRVHAREPARLGAVAADVNLIYLLLVPGAFAACMLGGHVFLEMSGDSYVAGMDLVRLLAIATLLYNGTLTTAPLLAAHHERIVVVASVVGVVLLAGVGIALIPTYGAEGAAIATGVAATGSKLLHVAGYRMAKLPVGDTRHLAALLGAIAFVGSTMIGGASYIPILVVGVVASALLAGHRLSRARLAI